MNFLPTSLETMVPSLWALLLLLQLEQAPKGAMGRGNCGSQWAGIHSAVRKRSLNKNRGDLEKITAKAITLEKSTIVSWSCFYLSHLTIFMEMCFQPLGRNNTFTCAHADACPHAQIILQRLWLSLFTFLNMSCVLTDQQNSQRTQQLASETTLS